MLLLRTLYGQLLLLTPPPLYVRLGIHTPRKLDPLKGISQHA